MQLRNIVATLSEVFNSESLANDCTTFLEIFKYTNYTLIAFLLFELATKLPKSIRQHGVIV